MLEYLHLLLKYLTPIIAAVGTLASFYYRHQAFKNSRLSKLNEARNKALQLNIEAFDMVEELALERNEAIKKLGRAELKIQLLTDQLGRNQLEIQKLRKLLDQDEKPAK